MDCLIVASDAYKLKILDCKTKQCTKTLLGPTYAGPINKLLTIPEDAENKILAYSTREKVI